MHHTYQVGIHMVYQLNEKGVDRKKMSTAEFREKCKEFALEQIELQKKILDV